ncbi:MAG: hypothetical protein GDA41_11070 [Rhodospirillales bacterium]|nr:hypothetical protein [Rhodospirillales bacterium]
MSKIRSLPRFCIGLSAAALLTLGLAGQAQSEYRPPLFDSLSSLQATFQGLADAIREHHEEQRLLEESRRRAEDLRRQSKERQRQAEERQRQADRRWDDNAHTRGMTLHEFWGF